MPENTKVMAVQPVARKRAAESAQREWAEIVGRAPRRLESSLRREPSVPKVDEVKADPGAAGQRLPDRPWGDPGARVVLWAVVGVIAVVAATLTFAIAAGGVTTIAIAVIVAVLLVVARRLGTAILERQVSAGVSPSTEEQKAKSAS